MMNPLRDLISIQSRHASIIEAYEKTKPKAWYEMQRIYSNDDRVWWQVRQTILESMR